MSNEKLIPLNSESEQSQKRFDWRRFVSMAIAFCLILVMGMALAVLDHNPVQAETHQQRDFGSNVDADWDWIYGTISTTTTEVITVYLQEIDMGFLDYQDRADGTVTEFLRWDKTGGSAGAWEVTIHGDASTVYNAMFVDLLDENVP